MLIGAAKKRTWLPLLAAGGLLLSGGAARAVDCNHPDGAACPAGQASKDGPNDKTASKVQPAGDPYLLDTDMVSGGKIEKAVVITFQGRELRFANEDSVQTFKAAPARYLAKIDAAMVKQQLPYYPLDKCVVSGEPLGGGMGEPMDYVYKNRLVRFCCEMCKASFDKDPAKYLAKLDEAAIARQKDAYASKTCPITGETLGAMGNTVDHVAGNRLIRFCCPSCVAKFNKEPLPALARLQGNDSAIAADHAAMGHGQHDHMH